MMRRTKWRLWAAMGPALCAFWVGGVAAQATGDGVVIGTVTNGTSGGTLPAGAPVTLEFFSESEWTNTYTSTLVYQDVSYYSEPANLDGEAAADILIYEATDDLSLVQVDQAHLFIVPTGDRLQIAEYYLIGNTGERTYIGAGDGDQRTTLAFTLPTAAMGLTFDGPGLGERFVGDATSFADSLPIPPGTATIEVDFSYELMYKEGLELVRELSVPVTSVVIIVNGSEIGLEGPGVEFGGMMDTQMGRAASYTVGPYAAGEPLVLRFVPQAGDISAAMETAPPVETAAEPSGPRERDPGSEALAGGAALAVAVFVAYKAWRSQPIPPMPDSARNTVADIVALDERYADGDVTGQEYARRRAALKRKARSYLPKEH